MNGTVGRPRACTAGPILCLQHDGTKVVSGAEDATTRLFDVRTGMSMWHTEEAHPVRHVCFSDRVLATAAYPLAAKPYKARDLFGASKSRILVLDFSPAANVSRVSAEYRSSYTVAPERSSYIASLHAPYTDLLGEEA